MAASHFLLLPHLSVFAALTQPSIPSGGTSTARYDALASSDREASAGNASEEEERGALLHDTEETAEEEGAADEEALEHQLDAKLPSLTTREKIELAKPLVKRYMVPLFFVYLAGTDEMLPAAVVTTADPSEPQSTPSIRVWPRRYCTKCQRSKAPRS